MSSGKKSWLPFVVAGGVFAAVMLAGIVANVIRGNYLAIPVVALILLLSVAAIWAGLWLNQRRIQIMFRQPTPDRLIEHYHATTLRAKARNMPDADAASAHLAGIAATIYGQYDRAREELASVDWNVASPVYQAHRMDTLALIALLEKQDTATALRRTNEAQALDPRDSASTSQSLRDAIRTACGEGDADTIKRTRRAADRAVGAIPAISAWALSLYLDRNGQPAEAAKYVRQARVAAPHFVAVQAPDSRPTA